MPQLPYACQVCNHRWPGHNASCPVADHPRLCKECNQPMYVSYVARIARHFSTESPACEPKEAGA